MRRTFSILTAFFLTLAGAAWGQSSPSQWPLASLPLTGQDAVLLDQGSGCATHTLPCATVQAPSTRVGQPVVQATPPTSPFPFQIWWDNSINPAQYKVYNGAAWVPVYQVDTTTGIPSFPGNVYLPSGNLGIGTTTVAPNYPITVFANNTPGTFAGGVAINSYENASGLVGGGFGGFAARGTLAAPAAVQANDPLALFAATGFWSGKTKPYFASATDQRAAILMEAAENWSSPNNNGTSILFKTTPLGSNVETEVARLNPSGLLGIGTTAPNFGVTLSRNNPIPSGNLSQGYTLNTYENGSGLVGGGFRGFSARGTLASPTAVVTNDPLLELSASGFWTGKVSPFWSGSDGRASIKMFAGENWTGSNNNGTYIGFFTTANGTGTQTERMRLQASGGLSVGTMADPGLDNLIVAGSASFGISTPLTLATGEVGLGRISASGTAPGAAGGKIALVCGTNPGTGKLIVYAGTSTTPTTLLDNIGASLTGC